MAEDRRSPLSIGILLPQEEGPGEPPPTWAYTFEAARTAEAVGFDAAWLGEPVLWDEDPWQRDPADYGEAAADGQLGTLEAWTTIAALAATTSRIRLGTLVACNRYRNPALLAKMADNVHGISGGRLVLGLGGGDNWEEHEQFGYPTERAVSHFEEALQIIVPLLRSGTVDFDGEAYRATLSSDPARSRVRHRSSSARWPIAHGCFGSSQRTRTSGTAGCGLPPRPRRSGPRSRRSMSLPGGGAGSGDPPSLGRGRRRPGRADGPQPGLHPWLPGGRRGHTRRLRGRGHRRDPGPPLPERSPHHRAVRADC